MLHLFHIHILSENNNMEREMMEQYVCLLTVVSVGRLLRCGQTHYLPSSAVSA